MRKRVINQSQQESVDLNSNQEWLNLENLIDVEISSEAMEHPIESALLPGKNTGWQASEPGKQTLRLIFTQPQNLQRIWLQFNETKTERTQEYRLRYSHDAGLTFQEIVRQQWNFSPTGSNSETEDHHVDLASVTVLELCIIPDINGGTACATLNQLRLG